MKKKQIITTCCVAAAILVGVFVWQAYFSATKIAFVNFQTINLGNISKANDNSFVKLREVSTDHLDELTGYDMVFVNGMAHRRRTTPTDTTGGRQRYTGVHLHGYQSRKQYLQPRFGTDESNTSIPD